MRRDYFIGAIIVIVAIVIAVIILFLTPGSPNAQITMVSTDRDMYHSSEVMTITVSLDSKRALDNTTVRIEGFEDRNGRNRLTHEINSNLSWGPNTFFYEYELPHCSSCAGLNPGEYNISVSLSREGEILDRANTSVRLEN